MTIDTAAVDEHRANMQRVVEGIKAAAEQPPS